MHSKWSGAFYTTKNFKRQWRRSGVLVVNFEHIQHLVLVFFVVNFEHVIAGLERTCQF